MSKVKSFEFSSIGEFVDYIEETPISKSFEDGTLKSSGTGVLSHNFTATSDYEEADKLLIEGWEDKAEELELKIRALSNSSGIGSAIKSVNVKDVVGYTVDVPTYLMGLPNCMNRKKHVYKKGAVIEIVKNISYHVGMTKEQILAESAKALCIVKSLEKLGHSVALYIAMIIRISKSVTGDILVCKIKIKSSRERINTLKLSYPLCHPSMLRRHMFAFIERQEVNRDITGSYGYALETNEVRKILKDSYVLPETINIDLESIKSILDIV